MDTLLHDVRFALRALSRRPGFAVVAVLTLALGIGANTAIFSVLRAVVLAPFPYPHSERLVMVWESRPEADLPRMYAAPPNAADWRRRSHTLAEIGVYEPERVFLGGEEGPVAVPGTRMSAATWSVLGVAPAVGRVFTAEEDRPDRGRVAVLSNGLWRRRFGADPSVVGRSVEIDDRPYQIVGVMPPGFEFPPPVTLQGTAPAQRSELWTPLAEDLSAGQRGAHHLFAVGRLRAGVGLEAARAELEGIAAGLAREHPDTNEGWSVTLVPFREQVVGKVAPVLWMLLAAVALVLLVACVNLANLLLAQAADRRQELAVRQALGAGPASLVRQVVTESLVLALIGGACGVFLGWSSLELLVALAPANVPRLDRVAIDGPVLAFTLGLAVLTGLAFGAAPALRGAAGGRSGWPRPGSTLRERSAGRSTLGDALVVAEVALSLVLLVGAGLLAQSFVRLRGVDPGFEASGVLTLRVSLPTAKYPEGADRARAFERLEKAASAAPGVRSAGFVLELPLDADRGGTEVRLEGEATPKPGAERQTNFTFATPGYFRTLGIPVEEGRTFDARDRRDSEPVVVVNRALAHSLAGAASGASPVGRRIVLGFNETPRRIVGVVGDVLHDQLRSAPFPGVYVPYAQFPWAASMALAVRTAQPPEAVLASVRARLREAEPGLPIYDARPMDRIVADAVAEPRFSALLVVCFAGLALVLAAVGIYGVIAYSVRRRTREIGVRVALGAARDDVLRLVLGRGMGLVTVGIGLGLGASAILARGLRGFLFEVSATDPWTFGALALFLAAVGCAACYLPTRRALSVDPRIALESE